MPASTVAESGEPPAAGEAAVCVAVFDGALPAGAHPRCRSRGRWLRSVAAAL